MVGIRSVGQKQLINTGTRKFQLRKKSRTTASSPGIDTIFMDKLACFCISLLLYNAQNRPSRNQWISSCTPSTPGVFALTTKIRSYESWAHRENLQGRRTELNRLL